jgi:hypothetical protein
MQTSEQGCQGPSTGRSSANILRRGNPICRKILSGMNIFTRRMKTTRLGKVEASLPVVSGPVEFIVLAVSIRKIAAGLGLIRFGSSKLQCR